MYACNEINTQFCNFLHFTRCAA